MQYNLFSLGTESRLSPNSATLSELPPSKAAAYASERSRKEAAASDERRVGIHERSADWSGVKGLKAEGEDKSAHARAKPLMEAWRVAEVVESDGGGRRRGSRNALTETAELSGGV